MCVCAYVCLLYEYACECVYVCLLHDFRCECVYVIVYICDVGLGIPTCICLCVLCGFLACY